MTAFTALLQELIDAPETEPVARVTGYYAGYLSIETIDYECCLRQHSGLHLPASAEGSFTPPPLPLPYSTTRT